ncbi:ABC transporter substrate-binding protein [Sphaerisporangium fuscum]|uniref:ABC transporter substrate-binding protein n=1 Tax=Sphaerisporangium fuscum TaxID=2835868 RepID=UPI001BDC43FE|nr:ABC transporter substrate-binding protein [Sphaerisporangium fuscum]
MSVFPLFRGVARPAAVVLVTAGCLTAAACGATAAPGASAAPRAAAAVTSSPAPGAYPVTVTNCGRRHTYTKPPSRVVVMNGASVAEVSTLLALGVGDRIIANAQSYGASDEPGRAEAIAALPTGGVKLNDLRDIPREAMLGLRPDLVLSTSGTGFEASGGYATREELDKAGAATYVPERTCGGPNKVEGSQTIEDSYAMLRDLGKIFGRSDRAEDLIAASKRKIDGVAAKVAGRPPAKVLYIIPGMQMGAADFGSVGANGIWNDIFAKAGAVNVFAGATRNLFADLSKEQVAAAEVDAVVIMNWHNPDPDASARKLFARFPQWEAAKRGRYVVLSDSLYLAPNNATAVEKIARILHPEVF